MITIVFSNGMSLTRRPENVYWMSQTSNDERRDPSNREVIVNKRNVSYIREATSEEYESERLREVKL